MPNPLKDVFLKLDGIDGECAVKGHEKEIDVFSYEQGIDLMVIHSAGGGSTAGRADFTPVRFRKNVDAASIPMLLACASGTHLREARFTFRRGGMGFEFYKVTLEDVLITHIVQRAGTGAQYPLSFVALDAGAASDGFLDEVTLDYQRIRWEYRVQNANGGVGATIKGGWDVAANKKL
jgi:type VI secretion system secreted protein Hcp